MQKKLFEDISIEPLVRCSSILNNLKKLPQKPLQSQKLNLIIYTENKKNRILFLFCLLKA